MATIVVKKWFCEPKIPASGRFDLDTELSDYNTEMGENITYGDDNPVWEYLTKAAIYGYTVTPKAGNYNTSTELNIDSDSLTFFSTKNDIKRIVSLGGDLKGYQAFFEFSPVYLSGYVPLDWPNSQYEPDPENNPGVLERRTVEQYYEKSQYPVTFNSGITYVIPNVDYETNALLDASLWILRDNIFQLRSTDWYKEQLSSQEA